MATQAPPAAEAPPPAAPGDGGGDASPDQLDRLLTLIRPRMWVVLAALLVLVGLAIVWGFVGTVSQTVQGSGIIQRGDGIRVVQAPVEGRILKQHVSHGAEVRTGAPLVTIEVADGGRTVVVDAPFDAQVIDEAVQEGSIVTAGQRLFALEPASGPLNATIAVPVAERSDLYVGERVEVRLDGAGDEELGFVRGEVERIDPYPSSDGELRRIFGSDRLVAQVTDGAAVYLVRVRLLTDPSTRSGLDWSSRTGASVEVHAGQLADATFVVSEQSLVQEIFP